MALTRNKLYTVMGIGCGVGYAWLIYNYNSYKLHNGFSVCIIKNVTGIPCPSCGSTRAVEALFHGQFIESILWNPFGVLLTSFLFILPGWIFVDLIRNKSSLYNSFLRAESFLRLKKYAIPAIMLVIANWIWNIYKGL